MCICHVQNKFRPGATVQTVCEHSLLTVIPVPTNIYTKAFLGRQIDFS